MFCPNCGKENSEIVNFCIKCGSQLELTENTVNSPSLTLKLVQRKNDTKLLDESIKKIQNWANLNNFKILNIVISEPNFQIELSKKYPETSKFNIDLVFYLVSLGVILAATTVIAQIKNEKTSLSLLFIPTAIYIVIYLFKKIKKLNVELKIEGIIKSNKVEIQTKSNKNSEALNNDILSLKNLF